MENVLLMFGAEIHVVEGDHGVEGLQETLHSHTDKHHRKVTAYLVEVFSGARHGDIPGDQDVPRLRHLVIRNK